MVKKFFIRSSILAFWLIVIGTFLYLSYLWPVAFKSKSINVFAWAGMIDLKVLARFERQTGIHVNVSFYETNEELLVKVRAAKGHGYDLIVPSDYAVSILHREGLLKRLDKAEIPFYSNLNPILLGHYFDPSNDYSIPYEWSIFGLGVDKDCFRGKRPPATWGLLFDPAQMVSKVAMSNDPLVAVPVASLYLYGTATLTRALLPALQALLIKQRPYVEAYADFRANYYLASKNVAVALASSADIARIMPSYPNIDFLVPHEGTMVTIESFALPIHTQKDDLVYEFMRFMYTPKMLKRNFAILGFFPPTTDIVPLLEVHNDTIRNLLFTTKEQFARFNFFMLGMPNSPVTEQDLYDLWVAVKS